MCQHVIILAERTNARYISQCEHGTVHLVWDGVGLHLPADAFTRLATHILQTRTNIQERDEAVPGTRARSSEDLPGTNALQAHCRLQVGRLTVTLPLQEFLPLAEMVDEVLPRVNQAGFVQMYPLYQLKPPFLN